MRYPPGGTNGSASRDARGFSTTRDPFSMNSNHFPWRLMTLATALVSSLIFIACSSSNKNPSQPEVPVAPTPNSPANALALLQWSWEQRDTAAYRSVLPGNFEYDFSTADSVVIGTTLDRDQELAIAGNLFKTGVGLNPAASRIVFGLPSVLTITDDDRPPRDPRWHKRTTASVRLIVDTPTTHYSTLGPAVFYFTRGDSAVPAPGFRAGTEAALGDSARWYVDTWVDQTTCTPGKKCVTTGSVKLVYQPVITVRAER